MGSSSSARAKAHHSVPIPRPAKQDLPPREGPNAHRRRPRGAPRGRASRQRTAQRSRPRPRQGRRARRPHRPHRPQHILYERTGPVMTDESMADRAYEDLIPDRDAQIDEIRLRLGELGDHEGLQRFDANMSEWEHSEIQAQNSHTDPASGLVLMVTEQLKTAMADLGAAPERLATVRVASTLQPNVSALYVPFRDGSSLVKVSELIGLEAANFVIGHEMAHHVLGHATTRGFAPGEELPVCSDNELQELEADLFACRASLRASERELAETPAAGTDIQIFALLGALIAMLAVHSTEEALFLRRGNSHPPARTRASLLLNEVGERAQQF